MFDPVCRATTDYLPLCIFNSTGCGDRPPMSLGLSEVSAC